MIRSISLVVVALSGALWGGAAHAQMSQADLLTRIDRIEAALRDLTGTVEQLQYRNQQLEQQLRALQDASQTGTRPPVSPPPPPSPSRPMAQYSTPPVAPAPAPVIAAAPPPAPIEPEPPPPPPGRSGRGDAFNPALNPAAPGAPRPLGTSTAATEPPPPVADVPPAGGGPRQPGAPLDLSSVSVPPPPAPPAPPSGAAPGGVLPPPPPSNPSGTGAMQATLPPSNSPKDEFDLAYGYLQHKDYGPAADAFASFLRQYPSDRLAPEAQFWMGEALFQSQRYRDAAEAFLAVSTKYDTTARAPDALLRLGMSLAALGEKEAACASLGEVLRKYPRASVSVKQGVDREQKRAHC